MTSKIQKTEKPAIPQDDRAEAQESWMRPGETPFQAYQRHQMELGFGHYM